MVKPPREYFPWRLVCLVGVNGLFIGDIDHITFVIDLNEAFIMAVIVQKIATVFGGVVSVGFIHDVESERLDLFDEVFEEQLFSREAANISCEIQ